MHIAYTGPRDEPADETDLDRIDQENPDATWVHGGAVGLWSYNSTAANQHVWDDFNLVDLTQATATATATTGPSPTATATPTPSETPGPTATATPIGTLTSAFPINGVLDNFNRSNGAIGGNWSGQAAQYAIQSNQLKDVSDGDIYWNASSFGANQEAYVTLSQVDSGVGEVDLILKSQSSSWSGPGILEVCYLPGSGTVEVWSYTSSQNWVQHGSSISVSYSNGDRFGAQATASGQVKIYKNSTLVGTVDASAYPYYDQGGYIGLWAVNASNRLFDDFGGGTIPQGSLPGGSLASLWSEARSWIDKVTGGGKVAAPVELKAAVAIQESELAVISNPPAGQVYRSYYFLGSVRVGMREFTGSTNVLSYIVTDHLGSTSMILDASGVEIVSMGYKPWGELRYPQQNPEFGYKFTGQMQLDIGIYHYGARPYDPLTGRFLSPDSIIPAPGNPLAFDRYAYVFNSPLMYVDPMGNTPVCGNKNSDPECALIDHSKGKISNAQLYRILMKIGFFRRIEKSDIPNPEGRPGSAIYGAITSYLGLRRVAFESSVWKYVDITGKVADVVVVAAIIQGEFGSQKGNVFNEALEAVSNQYYSDADPSGNMLCKGACTIETQISWLSDNEFATRQDKLGDSIAKGHWADQLVNAQLVIQPGGFQVGADNSWNWGNVSEDELGGYLIVDKVENNSYPGKPWFIVYSGKR